MKSLLSVFVLTLAFQAHARVEALFHPFDPTLEKIAQWISEADSTVDIAMYNMETGGNSPVILALKSPAIQKRLVSGDLKIRVIFEGYGPLADRNQKMQALENLGIDVRYLGKSVKVHHKFAVIDSNSHNNDRVISGSANWSLSSYRNYNENILFFESEKEITAEYQNEFLRLWNAAKEFGKASEEIKSEVNELHADQKDIQVHFNSGRTLDKSLAPVEITEHLVHLIDQAQSEISVASTRIRRTAILEALQRAAHRGVQIRLVISQDDYQDLYKRAQYLLSHPNIELRVKLYSLKVSDYLMYQMHNKFMIVDGHTLFTGSFNWSDSSEYNHIENVVELSGTVGEEVIPAYQKHFATLWNLGRDQYAPLLENLKVLSYKGCAIPAMALTPAEAKVLINLGRRCGGK